MSKETYTQKQTKTHTDTCRNACIPEDTPRKKHPQKDGVKGGQRESEQQRHAEMYRWRRKGTPRQRQGERQKEKETYRYAQAEGENSQRQRNSLKDRLRDGLRERERERERLEGTAPIYTWR